MFSKNEVDLCGRMSMIDFTEREEEKGVGDRRIEQEETVHSKYLLIMVRTCW